MVIYFLEICMEKHNWRENTDDGVRFYRATFHGGRWTVSSQMKGEEEWVSHNPIRREDWETLRTLIFNKYQRKRLPWKRVDAIDKILESLDEES